MFACLLQPIFDKIKIVLRRGDSLLRLLLERMKDIDGICQLNRLNSPESISVMVLDDLQHPRSSESLQRLGIRMLATLLCPKQPITHHVTYFVGETTHVLLRVAQPEDWFEFLGATHDDYTKYSIFVRVKMSFFAAFSWRRSRIGRLARIPWYTPLAHFQD